MLALQVVVVTVAVVVSTFTFIHLSADGGWLDRLAGRMAKKLVDWLDDKEEV